MTPCKACGAQEFGKDACCVAAPVAAIDSAIALIRRAEKAATALAERTRGDQLEREQARKWAAEVLTLQAQVKRLTAAITEYRKPMQHREATGDFPDADEMAEQGLWNAEYFAREAALDEALKEPK